MSILIIIYFIISALIFISLLLYIYHDNLKQYYYKLSSPEKLIKIVIYYPTGLYKEFYKLLSRNKEFKIDNDIYFFIEQNIVKKKKGRYIEIPYIDKNPNPIDYTKHKTIGLNSSELEDFKQNDLFKKLLTLEDEKLMLLFILLCNIGSFIGIIFIILKLTNII
jgi:hypothetical protein